MSNALTTARQIEGQLLRFGVALGVDWRNDTAVRELARQSLAYWRGDTATGAGSTGASPVQARRTLYGLIVLMLLTLQASPETLAVFEPGLAWQALTRAFGGLDS